MEYVGKFGGVKLGIHYDGESSEYDFKANKFTFNFKNEHILTECDDDNDDNDLPEPVGEL